MTQLANTVNFTVLAVYYVTVVRMDPLQLVLVGTALEGTILLCEVPTGLFADTFSHRLSVILGTTLLGVGCLIAGSLPLFVAILLADTIRGVGETFVDGAREAWIAGEVGEQRIAHVFARAAQARQFVAVAAIVASVALASVNLRLPVLAAGVLHLGLAGFLIVAMPEDQFARAPRGAHGTWRASWRSSLGEMAGTLRAGAGLVRRTPLLLAFLALALVFGAASEGFDRLWEAHLLTDFPFPALLFPLLGRLKPVVWFGVIQLVLMPLEIAGLELVRRRVDVARAGQAARSLIACTALQLVGVVMFALAGGFYVAVAGFGLADIARTLAYPIRDTWLTRSIDPRVRATALSLVGQSDALGQVAGGPGIGAIGKRISLRAAIACSGLLLAPALPLYGWTLRAGAQGVAETLLGVPTAGAAQGARVAESIKEETLS